LQTVGTLTVTPRRIAAMEIHNISEDLVMNAVNDICDEIEQNRTESSPCTCYQCRLDVACFALNRIAPHYVVSSRGVARAESDTLERQQEEADITSIVTDAIHRISKSKRPHFTHQSEKEGPKLMDGPAYNFPTIIGRVFSGVDFSPFVDIEARLIHDGELVTMLNPNWQNPYRLVESSAGTFSFWPAPIQAREEGIALNYGFMVTVSAPGFEELRYGFEIPLVSERNVMGEFSMERTHKLQDLYLFPPSDEDASDI